MINKIQLQGETSPDIENESFNDQCWEKRCRGADLPGFLQPSLAVDKTWEGHELFWKETLQRGTPRYMMLQLLHWTVNVRRTWCSPWSIWWNQNVVLYPCLFYFFLLFCLICFSTTCRGYICVLARHSHFSSLWKFIHSFILQDFLLFKGRMSGFKWFLDQRRNCAGAKPGILINHLYTYSYTTHMVSEFNPSSNWINAHY